MKFLVLVLCLAVAVSAGDPILSRFMRPTGLERFNNLFEAIRFGKIVGGVESEPHSHPYQVGLLIKIQDKTAFCGGSLISRTFVMTAAHCVYDGRNQAELFTIVLGAHNIYDEDNSLRLQSRTAVMHPGWNPSTLQNDIAVIRLPVDVEYNDKIQPINLPSYSAVGNSFSGASSVVSGWGKPSDNDNNLSPVLREVQAPVITNFVCNINYLGVIQSTHICTSGSDGKGSCSGDSGGPLTTLYQGRKIQIGIVSFGIAFGCEIGWPPAFTRVTSYLDWISSTAGIPIAP